jgi:hypothetical protein
MNHFEFVDLHISPNDYFEICAKVAAESDCFDDMDDKKWHPEDLYYNMSTITETVGQTLMHYVNIINNNRRVRKKPPETVDLDNLMREYQAANPARTQVFGGTIPNSELNNTPVYASNNVFGDNI